jgi:hypothetical protein
LSINQILVSGGGVTNPNTQTAGVQGSPTGTSSLPTFASLPSAASAAAGTIQYTSDQGPVYSNGSAWIPLGGGFVVPVFAGDATKASTNTAAIQAALNVGGEVYITTPGVVYVNSNLVYQSNTHVVLGENTTIATAPGTYNGNGGLTLWVSQAFKTLVSTILGTTPNNYVNGGQAVTLTQSGSFNAVNVAWTGHGLVEGNGVVIYGVSPTTLTATSGGSGYTTPGTYYNIPATTGGSGTGMRLNVTIAGGTATSVVIAFPGTNYVNPDTVSFSDASVGGRSGGAAFSTTVAVANTTNPYNGCFRVSKVVDANNFLIYTNYFATYAPTGPVKAIKAVQNFHLEGGTTDYNEENTGQVTINYPANGWNSFTVSLWGVMDSSVTRHTAISGGFGFHVQYAQNLYLSKIVSGDDQGATVYGNDGVKILGPSTNVVVDGYSGTFDAAAEFLTIQTSAPGAVFNWTTPTGYGDVFNITVRNAIGTCQTTGQSCDIHLYPSDQEVTDFIFFENVNLPNGLFQVWNGIAGSPYYTKCNVRGVTFKGCTAGNSGANQPSFFVGSGANLIATIDRITIENCSFNPASTTTASALVLASIQTGTVVNNFVCNGIVVDGIPSTSGGTSIVALQGGTVKNFTFNNCGIQNGVGFTSLFNMGGGTCLNVTFNGCFTDGTSNGLVNVTTAPTGAMTINITGCELSSLYYVVWLQTTGTYNINVAGNYLNSLGRALIRMDSTSTVVLRSSGSNNFNGQALISSTAVSSLSVYGWDLPVSPKVWTTSLPGGTGTLATTAGQFCTSTSAGSLMAGPAVLGNSSTWYALATGAAGVNTAISS